MPHILVVCTANVCRSPVAEALIGEKIARNQLSDWSVSSAGTWAMGPPTASAYSVQCMAERGLDIRDHRARKVDDALLEKADLVTERNKMLEEKGLAIPRRVGVVLPTALQRVSNPRPCLPKK